MPSTLEMRLFFFHQKYRREMQAIDLGVIDEVFTFGAK